ncbi:hypothetical protein WCE02_07600 [Pseudomonas juntendi]|nr:hypothetical protein [Pseudomonas putida]MEB3900582.1 hypothetical protein [Pseudomonas putida]
MTMDLAAALLSPQNRRLFKFHNLGNPEPIEAIATAVTVSISTNGA